MFSHTLWAWTLGLLLFVQANAQEKLVFRPLLHQPRIYQGAPAGVHVTTVHAYDPESPRKHVTYNLTNLLDHEYFVLDQESGNLTTAKQMNRNIGETYQVIVAAVSVNRTELEHLQIAVTEFNQFAPRFQKSVYQAEIHAQAAVDTAVLKVQAFDPDPAPHNAEVYYRMDQNVSSHFFSLAPLSGQLTLVHPVNTTQQALLFGVFAEDGGSPKRWAHVQVEVMIKAISAPLDMSISNVTDSAATVCWALPEYGDVIGYVLKYRESGSEDRSTKEANVTSDLFERCTTLSELRDGTKYDLRVYAWNHEGTGQGTELKTFTTRENFCLQSICKKGDCTTLTSDPWFRCDCPAGYYGHRCEFFDPCSQNPCGNNGTCLNTTHNKYVCTCPPDFTGPNCGSYNPCLRQPPLCQNGGSCQTTTNHTFLCLCAESYYGRRCQRRNLCYSNPCLNGGVCTNTSAVTFKCTCPPGVTGDHCENDIDECASDPCSEGATCLNNHGNFSCICAPGYVGVTCDQTKTCPQDLTDTDKGMFYWNATTHGRVAMISCPFGALDSSNNSFAARACRLLSNGMVIWAEVDASSCRGKGFLVAEELAGELHTLTRDPATLNNERLQTAAQGVETILRFAAQDKKLAQGMVKVISNVLNINDSVMEQGDENGTVSDRLLQIVDEFTSSVQLPRGESLKVKTENVFIQTMDWHPELSKSANEALIFTAPSPPSMHTGEKEEKMRNEQEDASGSNDLKGKKDDAAVIPLESDEVHMMQLYVPHEALQNAHSQLDRDVRVKFIVYYNDKLFQSRKEDRSYSEMQEGNPKSSYSTTGNDPDADWSAHPVLQISVGNIPISNLSNPLVYIFPSTTKKKVFCVFWKEKDRTWSKDGLTTNQTEKFIICTSTHLTAFSVLLDPTPHVEIAEAHREVLSLISYVGCALSLLGLSLTILTYSLFRCLNRDHSGKILLNLCLSLLLMNSSFLLGAFNATHSNGFCAAVALLIHYFLLTSLAWMCVEAINMYQLLVHVFASAETHFLLKRCIMAWGGPLIVVAATVSIGLEEYYNQNTFCMLSPRNPWIYYFAFLGPSCIILAINLAVFVLVSRVLFAPRLTAKTGAGCSATPAVTAAQVRGAFTVMVLLGVTWVFGTFAVGEAKLIFQYIFCVANSLQGFLIFLVRCLHYPEARSAWLQLVKAGKLKKYRGVLPPGAVSWSTNSHSGGKQNGQTTTTSRLRSDSTDGTGTLVFNSNFWNRSDRRETASSYRSQQLGIRRNSNSNGLKTVNILKEQNMKEEILKEKDRSSPPLNNLSNSCTLKSESSCFANKGLKWKEQKLNVVGNCKEDEVESNCGKVLIREADQDEIKGKKQCNKTNDENNSGEVKDQGEGFKKCLTPKIVCEKQVSQSFGKGYRSASLDAAIYGCDAGNVDEEGRRSGGTSDRQGDKRKLLRVDNESGKEYRRASLDGTIHATKKPQLEEARNNELKKGKESILNKVNFVRDASQINPLK